MKAYPLMKKGALIAFVSIVGVFFAACQPQTALTPTPVPSSLPSEVVEVNEIAISNFNYVPETLTVTAGATIRVTNNDSDAHTVTSDDGSSFDTGLIEQGQTVEFTAPTTPGTYTYHCIPHPMMKGTLIVE